MEPRFLAEIRQRASALTPWNPNSNSDLKTCLAHIDELRKLLAESEVCLAYADCSECHHPERPNVRVCCDAAIPRLLDRQDPPEIEADLDTIRDAITQFLAQGE